MNKLIQSIILSVVVLAPVSSLDLVADAMMHHTPAHVSNLALEVARPHQKYRKYRKYRKVRVKAKKSVAKRSPNQRSTSRQQNPSKPKVTIPTSNFRTISTPSTFAPQTPGSLPPAGPKRIDPIMGNPVNPPSSDVKLPNPAAGIPTIPLALPGGIPNPAGDTSIPNPNLPIVFPGGAIK